MTKPETNKPFIIDLKKLELERIETEKILLDDFYNYEKNVRQAREDIGGLLSPI